MTRRGSWRAALGVVVALALPSLSARADHGSEARMHNERAMAAFALDRFDEAALEYENAFAAKPVPELLYNAAQSFRLAGKKERALRLYQSYLRVFGKSVHNRAEVETHIANLQRAIESAAHAVNAAPISTEPLPVAPGALEPRDPSPPRVTTTPVSRPTPRAERIDLTVTTPSEPRPLTRRPLFWVAIGGIAAVVIAVVIVGVVFGTATRYPSPTVGTIAEN